MQVLYFRCGSRSATWITAVPTSCTWWVFTNSLAKVFVNILKIFVWYPALTYEVLLRYILPVNFVGCSWWRVIILFLKVRNLEEKDELVPCPGTILRAIARILIDRWKLAFYFTSNIKKRRERDLAGCIHSLERRHLLQRVAHLEEEMFSDLISTLPSPASSNRPTQLETGSRNT